MATRYSTRSLRTVSVLSCLAVLLLVAPVPTASAELVRPWASDSTPWMFLDESQMLELVGAGLATNIAPNWYAIPNLSDALVGRRRALYQKCIFKLGPGSVWNVLFLRNVEVATDVVPAESVRLRADLEASHTSLDSKVQEVSTLQGEVRSVTAAYAAVAEKLNQRIALEPELKSAAQFRGGLVGATGGVSVVLLILLIANLIGSAGRRARPPSPASRPRPVAQPEVAQFVPGTGTTPGPRPAEAPSARSATAEENSRVNESLRQAEEATNLAEAMAADEELLVAALHNHVNRVATRAARRNKK